MTFEDFKKQEQKKLLSGKPKKITKKEYYNMLEVLPPQNYITVGNITEFCMSEHYTGVYTSQYAYNRANNTYYTKIVDVTDEKTWLHNLLK